MDQMKYFTYVLLILAIIGIATIIATITESDKHKNAALEQQKTQIKEDIKKEIKKELKEEIIKELKEELKPYKTLPYQREHNEEEENFEPISA